MRRGRIGHPSDDPEQNCRRAERHSYEPVTLNMAELCDTDPRSPRADALRQNLKWNRETWAISLRNLDALS